MAAALDTTLRKARAMSRAGDNAAAAEMYLGILERFPSNKRARSGLAEATTITDRAETARLNDALAVIKELLSRGQNRDALERLQALTEQSPHIPVLHNELGTIYVSLSMGDEAEAAFAQAHRLAPLHPDFAANYGTLLAARNREPKAIEILDGVLARHPDHIGARRGLGRAYLGLGQCASAIVAFDTVLAHQPNDVDCQANRASAHFSLGHKDAAVADILSARARAPERVEFMRMYCHMATIDADDPVIGTMQAALVAPESCPKDLLRLHFALAKIHHDLGEREAAFAHWAEANRLNKTEQNYDISQDEILFSQAKSLALSAPSQLDVPAVTSRRPIFVVGMPRSGTSLVEQILSSHPQVHGAGELADFSIALNAVGGLANQLTQSNLKRLRQLYLDSVAMKTPDAPWVIDKMTVNFRLIGQIVAALPEAKIIHIQRDPMATCWSNFRHFFPSGGASNNFGHDLSDLGKYWRLYNDLMAFWDQTFPGAVHTIQYEQLTRTPQAEIAPLLDHIGLPWDDACLRFHETTRAVMTTSADQVRRPIYSGSSKNWQAYEHHLGPLRDALGDVLTVQTSQS